MGRFTARFAATAGVAAILVAACSSGATPTPSASTAPPAASTSGASTAASVAPVAAKDAKSAADMGGVEAVCAAGKAEGQVNIIATPPD